MALGEASARPPRKIAKARRKSAGVLGFVRSLLPNLFQSEDQEVEEEVVDDNEVRKTTITGKTSAGSEELQSETRHDERNTSVYPPSSLASVLEQKNREPEATPNGRPSSFWQEEESHTPGEHMHNGSSLRFMTTSSGGRHGPSKPMNSQPDTSTPFRGSILSERSMMASKAASWSAKHREQAATSSPFHSGGIGFGDRPRKSLLNRKRARPNDSTSSAANTSNEIRPTKRRVVPQGTPRGSALTSNTAKRILETLNRVSTPQVDSSRLVDLRPSRSVQPFVAAKHKVARTSLGTPILPRSTIRYRLPEDSKESSFVVKRLRPSYSASEVEVASKNKKISTDKQPVEIAKQVEEPKKSSPVSIGSFPKTSKVSNVFDTKPSTTTSNLFGKSSTLSPSPSVSVQKDHNMLSFNNKKPTQVESSSNLQAFKKAEGSKTEKLFSSPLAKNEPVKVQPLAFSTPTASTATNMFKNKSQMPSTSPKTTGPKPSSTPLQTIPKANPSTKPTSYGTPKNLKESSKELGSPFKFNSPSYSFEVLKSRTPPLDESKQFKFGKAPTLKLQNAEASSSEKAPKVGTSTQSMFVKKSDDGAKSKSPFSISPTKTSSGSSPGPFGPVTLASSSDSKSQAGELKTSTLAFSKGAAPTFGIEAKNISSSAETNSSKSFQFNKPIPFETSATKGSTTKLGSSSSTSSFNFSSTPSFGSTTNDVSKVEVKSGNAISSNSPGNSDKPGTDAPSVVFGKTLTSSNSGTSFPSFGKPSESSGALAPTFGATGGSILGSSASKSSISVSKAKPVSEASSSITLGTTSTTSTKLEIPSEKVSQPVFGNSTTVFGTSKPSENPDEKPAPSSKIDFSKSGKIPFGSDKNSSGTDPSPFKFPKSDTSNAPFGKSIAAPASSPFGSLGAPTSGTSDTPTIGKTSTASSSKASATFGQPSETPTFGNTTAVSTSKAPPFGGGSGPTFGQPSETPTFGKTSTASSSAVPTFGNPSTPSFGQTPVPAFGSGSGTPFGQPSNTPTSSSGTPFGNPSTANFGQASAFGNPSTPSFPQTTQAPALGAPAFGTGAPAFGQTSGKPAFGNPATPSFGQTQAPMFGNPSTTGFGQTPDKPAFGAPAFGGGDANAFAGGAAFSMGKSAPKPGRKVLKARRKPR
eukprot:m.102380 g.102380  ORF g.102380 m.102380 type:complete len:1147 (+) comp13771_c0_seq3:298-3738(+)